MQLSGAIEQVKPAVAPYPFAMHFLKLDSEKKSGEARNPFETLISR